MSVQRKYHSFSRWIILHTQTWKMGPTTTKNWAHGLEKETKKATKSRFINTGILCFWLRSTMTEISTWDIQALPLDEKWRKTVEVRISFCFRWPQFHNNNATISGECGKMCGPSRSCWVGRAKCGVVSIWKKTFGDTMCELHYVLHLACWAVESFVEVVQLGTSWTSSCSRCSSFVWPESLLPFIWLLY